MRSSGDQTTLEPGRPAALLGQRVAFTGQFSTLSRAQAEHLVALAAGRTTASVCARTTMLVVGMRGWPLMNSGSITGKLAEAERLRRAGKPIRVLSEIEFREVVGLETPPKSASKSLTAEQVCNTLGIDAQTLQRWEHCGLVRGQQGRYDFLDLVSLRTVTGLVARGVSPVVIRKSLDALSQFLPGVERPLAQLKMILSDSGRLVAELEEALLTTSGQLEIRFDAQGRLLAETSHPLPLPSIMARDCAAWIEAGLELEESGELSKAESAYRQAAALAPNDPVPHFNLGNILLAGGFLKAAAERYFQAVALDPSHAQAWFNLAHVQDALDDHQSAMKSLQQAIAADPTFADAHYNFADLAERLGERDTAAAAWKDYIDLDPASDWSGEARRRLTSLKRADSWA